MRNLGMTSRQTGGECHKACTLELMGR